MRLLAVTLPLLFALAVPTAALAAEPAAGPATQADDSHPPADPGARTSAFELGARVGYALPFGSVAKGVQLESVADGAIPVAIDVGWRADRSLFVGGYASLADVLVAGAACSPGASCSGSDVRVGVQAHYSFHPIPGVSPWVGVGAGYEWLHIGATRGSSSAGFSVQGFELVNLQAGVDLRVSEGFRVGPFAEFSVGEFQSFSTTGVNTDGASVSGSGSIEHQATHEWLTLGVRGRFDL